MKNIKTLKIRKNGTLKLAREYDDTVVGTGTPGRAGYIIAGTNYIALASGISSGVLKGLIVEQTTTGEDQNKISILGDDAEVTVDNGSLASGVHFTIGGNVYHDGSALLTTNNGCGNKMGISLEDMYANSGATLDMLTRSAQEIARE